MVHLTLAGLSEDGTRLLLVSDTGEQFTLAVDHRLRAALRGEHARLGQLEITMESTLRPRDIQNRIRAGETPEAVAQAAQTTVDRIMPFANPVLAERAHVAQRAQRASVRRRSGDERARTLGEAVTAHLRAQDTPADSVAWDAWRREDGRWMLQASFSAGSRTGRGTFVFDAPGNYVTTEDADARWLIGDGGGTPSPARDDLKQARQRRLSAVHEDELPLGDDAIELANETVGAEPDSADAEDAALSPTPEPFAVTPEFPAEPEDESPDESVGESAEGSIAEEPDPDAEDAPERPTPRRPTKKRGRASVPSWDEIMFGGGDRG